MKHFAHTAGFLCQGLSGLNVDRTNLNDERSGLITEARRLGEEMSQSLPDIEIHSLTESMASMDDDAREQCAAERGKGLPYRLCSKGFSWKARPLYYWLSWKLKEVVEGFKRQFKRGFIEAVATGLGAP